MPQYRNPYDFVPLEAKPTCLNDKPSLVGDNGLSGRISYTLTTLTPLCIHQDPGQPVREAGRDLFRFARLGRQPAIPATSLKGMLRAVHEALTNSTMGLLNSRAWYAEDEHIPAAYRPGGPGLTASEALFGMVGQSKDYPDGRAGRLFIDDIVLPDSRTLRAQPVSRPAGGQPKPAHKSFYFRPDGQVLGRKFYYHQHNYRDALEVYKRRRMPEIEVEAIPGGTSLIGCLRFVALTEAELDALIYTLILEDGLAHKLGYGKPLGLGSVRIAINDLEIEPQINGVPARFRSYGTPTLENCNAEIDPRRERARAAWQQRPGGGAASYAAFAAIARWPQNENFIYPDFSYFRNQGGRGSQESLWQYQGRTTDAYYPGTATPLADDASRYGQDTGGASDKPEQTPPPAPNERRRGLFARRSEVGISVQDELDERIYQVRPTDGASRKLLRRLVDQLDDQRPPLVSFRIEIDRDLDGKQVYVAVDLQLEGAD